jgi:HSP20 family protein
MGAPPRDRDIDFVPKADVFDTPAQYLVHVSLPGGRKEDISVDYDAASSTLRLAGVVYRPGIDESLSESLVLRGRDGEVGVFGREIRLGTPREPAYVDVDHISASMTDGVLIVVLPKLSDSDKPQKTKILVTQVDKDGNKEALPDYMEVESETEAGDGPATPPSPTARDEEDEEREYITVDVD